MTNELIRNVVFARAMVVEPFARAICPDPLDYTRRPFTRSEDRWRQAAGRAAKTSSSLEIPEPAGRPAAGAGP